VPMRKRAWGELKDCSKMAETITCDHQFSWLGSP